MPVFRYALSCVPALCTLGKVRELLGSAKAVVVQYVDIAPSARFPYTCRNAQTGKEPMTILEREFYRSARGPAPADEDTWRLVFDQSAKRLFVRHEWHAMRHAGTDEFTLDEFLIQRGAALPDATRH
jgi:hypothetical protein